MQKRLVNLIEPDGDEEIQEAQDILKDKLSKIKINKIIESLFFSSGYKNRSQKYYAWWDEEQEEVIIYTYAKAIAHINRPRI